jgi:hypothetical protein
VGENDERILRGSVEVDGDESKRSEVNWVDVVCFPGHMAFSKPYNPQTVAQSETHPGDKTNVIENLHDG